MWEVPVRYVLGEVGQDCIVALRYGTVPYGTEQTNSTAWSGRSAAVWYGTGGTGTERLQYWGFVEQIRCDSVVVIRREAGIGHFVLSGREEEYGHYCQVIRLLKW